MDQADKIKLTKFGFRMNLLGASTFVSVLGIIVSIIGVIGSIACFVLGSMDWMLGSLFVIGSVILIIMIPYLIMWILLKIKTSKKDILGIERIGKVYCYVSGSLEIIAMIARILGSIHIVASLPAYLPAAYLIEAIVYIIVATIYLVFAILKIHGVRVENNKLVGIYLGFRYGLLVLQVIGFIIFIGFSLYWYSGFIIYISVPLLFVGIHFILDIGLIVILRSIRVNKGNSRKHCLTETAMRSDQC